MTKKKHSRRMRIIGKEYKDTSISKFRKHWLKRGYDLFDITQLCNFRLGKSGYCNDFDEPDENIYHLKVYYRDEELCSFPDPNRNISKDYIVFITNTDDITGADFIIFRKVKL